MFDAEIAAKLLNRWGRKPPSTQHDTYLDLLREGNLGFTHQQGRVSLSEGASPFELESLVFLDGSRALRVSTPGRASEWTQWAALEPAVAFEDVLSPTSFDESQCASEASAR